MAADAQTTFNAKFRTAVQGDDFNEALRVWRQQVADNRRRGRTAVELLGAGTRRASGWSSRPRLTAHAQGVNPVPRGIPTPPRGSDSALCVRDAWNATAT